MSNLISFKDVGLRYGTGTTVLSKITFAIKEKSFFFLTGPSGCGKSSLLKLMSGDLSPSQGDIEKFGRSISELDVYEKQKLRSRISYIPQELEFIDHLTVLENVMLPVAIRGTPVDKMLDDAIDLCRWVGLEDFREAFPSSLSGGQKQRTALARGFFPRPEILLADEPTAHLDPPLARRILRLFVELSKLGTSIVIATHDKSLLRMIDCDHLTISNGRLSIE